MQLCFPPHFVRNSPDHAQALQCFDWVKPAQFLLSQKKKKKWLFFLVLINPNT